MLENPVMEERRQDRLGRFCLPGSDISMMRITEGMLLLGAFLLSVLLLCFGNSAVFPLGVVDFVFFSALAFFCSLYRPGWAFLLFISLLPFEMIDLSSDILPLSIRPYQLLGSILILSIVIRFVTHRLPFLLMRFRWFDVLPIVFGVGGLLSIGFAPDGAGAAKQSVVALSFVALYFLSRQFLGEVRDVRRVMPFLLLASASTALFSLWQSMRFTEGLVSFEVMPGRPNAFFSEPDWLGMFCIAAGSMALALLFYVLHERSVEGDLPKHASGEQRPYSRQLASFLCRYSNGLLLLSCFLFLTLSLLGLLLTVARSAWAGFAFSLPLFLLLLLWARAWHPRFWYWKRLLKGVLLVVSSGVAAIFVIAGFHLTTFDLTDRAGSAASGQQRITVSCDTPTVLPESIADISELSSYGCRFIRLEAIDAEQAAGKFIGTVSRPDPSIEARRVISRTIFETLRSHWLFGIGWGSIGNILGTDDRGASLNASNAFLEAWLGGGLISGLSFLVLWILIPIFALRTFFARGGELERVTLRSVAVFFLVSWIGFTVFNVFNSGVLLGFVWVWLGGIGIIAGRGK